MSAHRVAMSAEDRDLAVRHLGVGVIFVAALTFVVLGRDVLAGRFEADGLKIQALAQGYEGTWGEGSYYATATIYRELGLAHEPMLASLFGFTCFLVVLLVALRGRLANATPVQMGMILAIVAMGAVYLGWYSKDVFVLPVALIALWRVRGIMPELALVGAMALYAWGMRQYWWLVLACYVGLRLFTLRRFSIRRVVVAGLCALAVLSVVFREILGVELDHFRVMVNERRAGGLAMNTAIDPFVVLPDPIGGLVNSLLVLVSFAIPIPLLLLGEAYYIVISAMFVLVWFQFFGAMRAQAAHRPDQGWLRACCLVLALTVVQSVFEPDYGSYVRHLTPLLPVLLAAVLWPRPAPAPTNANADADADAEGARPTEQEGALRAS